MIIIQKTKNCLGENKPGRVFYFYMSTVPWRGRFLATAVMLPPNVSSNRPQSFPYNNILKAALTLDDIILLTLS
jgi:hypothetical protein